MKKLFSLILALSLALSGITVFAEREATVNTEQNNIYISGQADANIVTMLMKNKTDNTIAYADEIETDNGKYSFKFKFNNDYNNYSLYVMDGSKNITDTVMETKAEAFYPVGEITQNKFSDDGTKADISAYIENKYNDEGCAKVIVSWLDESGIMVSCVVKDIAYDYYSGTDEWTLDVPEKAVKAKVLVWSSLANCIPLATPSKTLPNKNVVLIGTSICAEYDELATPQRGWGMYFDDVLEDGANVLNHAHAGWTAHSYMMYDDADSNNFWSQGWNYSKKFLKEGDVVIFYLGGNDYKTKGYNGKYYETVNGENILYYGDETGNVRSVTGKECARDKDNNGEYINTDTEGKIYIKKSGSSDLTPDVSDDANGNKYLSFFYTDEDGNLRSYASDLFYDCMKLMLNDCKEIGVDVVLASLATRADISNGQFLVPNIDNTNFHGYKIMAMNNQIAEQLAKEYDNAVYVDIQSPTREYLENFYHEALKKVANNDLPDDYYDDEGNIQPWIKDDRAYQMLLDEHWLTISSYSRFYKNGTPVKTSDGSWVYQTADGELKKQDSVHYVEGYAYLVAKTIADEIKKTDSLLAEYVR